MIELVNSPDGDHFYLASSRNKPLGDMEVSLSWQLDDSSGAALNSTTICA